LSLVEVQMIAQVSNERSPKIEDNSQNLLGWDNWK
jgi:hypothetical protein